MERLEATIGEVLRTSAAEKPSEALLRKTLRAIRSHLSMDVAFISQFTDGQRVFRYVDSDFENQPVKEGGGGPLEGSYCQRVADGRLPELIPDPSALPAALELPVTKALPVGAHMSIPIRLSDGSIYGTFCCFSFKPNHALNERDLAVMRVFAELTADYVEKDIARSSGRREIESRIKRVLAGGELSSVYQPVYDLDKSAVAGFECLSRFAASPKQGPDKWFAEASSVGLGIALELKALERAFLGFKALPGHVYLAANVSPPVILSGQLTRILGEHPLNRLVLEITEHETIEDYATITETLRSLRADGMRVSVDDAGAGYASFRHILRLRPDYIKLDRSLISSIETDPARRALATAFVSFAGETGAKIVAEGVETKAELDALRALGVRKAQGYYFSKPVPIAEAQALLT